jgi:hypothetical protein
VEDNRVCNENMLKKDIEEIDSTSLYVVVGNDAIINFGEKFKGCKISAMMKTNEGKNYLAWIMQKDFPKELQEIIGAWWRKKFD